MIDKVLSLSADNTKPNFNGLKEDERITYLKGSEIN
jgi:hypothetical protein